MKNIQSAPSLIPKDPSYSRTSGSYQSYEQTSVQKELRRRLRIKEIF